MNILILAASPLGASSVTLRLAQRLVQAVFPEAGCRVVQLADAGLPPCDGGLGDITAGEQDSPAARALAPIRAAMREADVVVFASPVHNFTVSALMKNFIDLMVVESHRPGFIGKPALLVSTAMGAGQQRVFHYLQEVVHSWGFRVVGRLGAATSMLGEPWYEARVALALERLRRRVPAAIAETRPRVGLRDLIAFNVWRLVVELNREDSPVDHRYWQQRGWLGADYYFPCRSLAPARWLARLVVAMVRRSIVGRHLRPVS